MSVPDVLPRDELEALCAAAALPAWAVLPLADPLPSAGLDRLLADGVGDMDWLARHRDLRLDPAGLEPGAVSALVALFPCPGPGPRGTGLRRAAFGYGRDYHGIHRPALGRLGKALVERWRALGGGPARTRACVDSAPLNERSLARLAGLGWIGRQGLLVHRSLGCRIHLGILLSTVPLPPTSAPHRDEGCGSCHRCVAACPTGAVVDRRVLSERCISYLTIEHRGVIPREAARRFGGRWFGCDACTDCCPCNRPVRVADDGVDPLAVGPDAFDAAFAAGAVRRLGYERFRRNLLVACWSLDRDDAVAAIVDEGLPLVLAQATELGVLSSEF